MEQTLKEMLKEYPYLSEITDKNLIISNDEYYDIKYSETIKVDNKNISINFLKSILTDKRYHVYIDKFFNNEIEYFNVTSIMFGDTMGKLGYSKAKIIKGIEQLLENNTLTLNEEQTNWFSKLKSTISYDKYLKSIETKTYNTKIDNIDYQIPIKDLISVLKLSMDYLENEDTKVINNIPKEHIIYALLNYIEETKIIDEYLILNDLVEKYYNILYSQKIDTESINKLTSTEDELYKETKLNKDLEDYILSDIDDFLSKLEKAIYIYIKLCKTLTYDDEFYAFNQKGDVAIKHKDINFISTITPTNNKVVCYEFNLIYSIFLSKLGINFKSNYRNLYGESYGESHVSLDFRVGKYLVNADSVTSILGGDLFHSKLNEPLRGLKCKNKNKYTQEEFKKIITKVYKILADTDTVEHTKTLDELINEYESTTTNYKEVSFDEKFSILQEKINSSKMSGIDSLSYLLHLQKILFNEIERENNINISIIKENKIDAVICSAIITINKLGFTTNNQENKYFYYTPNSKIESILLTDLEEKFNNSYFEYISDDIMIPNLITYGGLKK